MNSKKIMFVVISFRLLEKRKKRNKTTKKKIKILLFSLDHIDSEGGIYYIHVVMGIYLGWS